MQLHCLGTVGYHPNESRHTSCYFLPESGIVLDGGSGLFRLNSLIETDSLDILLSHAHLDHTLGLTFLVDILFRQSLRRLRIWGEADKLRAIQDHLFSELIFPARLNAEWVPIDSLECFTIGEAEVSWQKQPHPGGSVAYRIDWSRRQKRLVYATDTSGDTSEAATRWRQDADLLLHECYFRDADRRWAQRTGHCWTTRLAKVAALCKPKKLLVTHISPIEAADDPVDLPTIRKSFAGEVILAEDRAVIDF
jgi:ribonuclease BN (tRNA processing enzyme)